MLRKESVLVSLWKVWMEQKFCAFYTRYGGWVKEVVRSNCQVGVRKYTRPSGCIKQTLAWWDNTRHKQPKEGTVLFWEVQYMATWPQVNGHHGSGVYVCRRWGSLISWERGNRSKDQAWVPKSRPSDQLSSAEPFVLKFPGTTPNNGTSWGLTVSYIAC